MTPVAAGVHEKAAPADTAAEFPGAIWAREFVAGVGGGALPSTTTTDQLVAKVKAKTAPALAAGGGCVVSVKLPLAAVARGDWDGRLIALGVSLTGQQVIVIVNHEPEDDMPASVFVPGFTAARRALKAGWADLDVAYCAMAYQFASAKGKTKDAQAWAAVEADWYLVDCYSGRSFPETAILPEHPGFVRWYAEVVAAHPGRRWGVAERGIITGPTRPATFRREGEWLVSDPGGRTCQMWLAWSTGGTENNPGWILNDEASRDAVAELLQRITAPAQPSGYEPGPMDGVLVHTDTGLLVAEGQTSAFEAYLARNS